MTLGLQILALKLMAWLWCPGLVGTQVPSVSEGQSPRWQRPRAGDVGMEGCWDVGMEGFGNGGKQGCRDGGMEEWRDLGMEG